MGEVHIHTDLRKMARFRINSRASNAAGSFLADRVGCNPFPTPETILVYIHVFCPHIGSAVLKGLIKVVRPDP